jgi:hypothetical protein
MGGTGAMAKSGSGGEIRSSAEALQRPSMDGHLEISDPAADGLTFEETYVRRQVFRSAPNS